MKTLGQVEVREGQYAFLRRMRQEIARELRVGVRDVPLSIVIQGCIDIAMKLDAVDRSGKKTEQGSDPAA